MRGGCGRGAGGCAGLIPTTFPTSFCKDINPVDEYRKSVPGTEWCCDVGRGVEVHWGVLFAPMIPLKCLRDTASGSEDYHFIAADPYSPLPFLASWASPNPNSRLSLRRRSRLWRWWGRLDVRRGRCMLCWDGASWVGARLGMESGSCMARMRCY
jgi:hypothetical protein